MGYTHYFELNKQKPTVKQWQKIKQDVLEVFRKYGDILIDVDNQQWPTVTDDHILFNGIGADAHEDFYIDRNLTGFNFCKTAQKPYDAAVVEVLKVIKKHSPRWVDLSSDGDVFN